MNTSSPVRKIYHVTDEAVQSAARDAVLAATESLDATFPGGDGDGVNTNFAGLLETAIVAMLSGTDPLRTSRTISQLNVLVYDDHHFGDPFQKGKMFAVIQRVQDEWDDSLRRDVPVYRALDDDARRFVPMGDGESIDPCISFAAAVKEAIKWLRREGRMQEETQLQIRAVEFDGTGYKVSE